MSLKVKTLVIFVLTLIGFMFIQQALHHAVILPGIIDLEDMQAEKNSHRPEQALKREVFYLSSLVHDWASWDDTHAYMQSRARINENNYLVPEATFQVSHIHLITLLDRDKNQVWSKIISPATGQSLTWEEFTESFPWESGDPAFDEAWHDILPTPYGPLMVVSRPILSTKDRGPSMGLFIMGRFLDRPFIKRLEEQTGVPFELIPVTSIDRSPQASVLLDVVRGKVPVYIEKNDKDTLSTYSLPSGLQQAPTYLVKTTLPRDIYQKGLESTNLSTAALVIVGVILVFPALVLLNVFILKPIRILSKHVRSVEESGDLSLRLNLKRRDEIGSLARRFDSLMEKLSSIRSYLLEQSYMSGLSGLASDIIHQGRNTLMPLASKTETAKLTLTALPCENIRKALEEIDAGQVPPEREASLNRFLYLSADEMLKAITGVRELLNDIMFLQKDMEVFFGDIEKHSRSQNIITDVSPSTLVRQALSQLPPHFLDTCDVDIGPEIETLPDVTLESQVLMHVFHAILAHSISFAARNRDGKGRIHIRARMEQAGREPRIRFIVENNGPAQDMDSIKEMFTRVYAERNRLPFCSGLHWCSNVVRAMRGELDLINENNQTAFHLILPMGGEA